MKKINKRLLIITSLLTLLPIVVGFLLWSYLPDNLPTHFDLSGQADHYNHKTEAILTLPLIILAVHLFCVFIVSKDPRSSHAGRKMLNLIYWFCPFLSNIVMLAIYLTAMKIFNNNLIFMNLLLGLIFLVLGNYLPKTRQSYTVGIRLPWTLANEENWQKTHRLAGKLWVIGGLLILLDGLFHLTHEMLTVGTLCVLIILPIVYSFIISQRKKV